MVDHNLQVLAMSKFDEFLGLTRCQGEWLLHEYVLSVIQCGLGQLKVGPNRSYDSHYIDARRSEQRGYVVDNLDIRMRTRNSFERLRPAITNHRHARVFLALEIADHIWSPIPITDDPHAQDNGKASGIPNDLVPVANSVVHAVRDIRGDRHGRCAGRF